MKIKTIGAQLDLFLGAVSPTHGADFEPGKTVYSQLCFNCHGPS